MPDQLGFVSDQLRLDSHAELVNVPLNDGLADGGTRDTFETPWVRWHYFRTGAATVAFILLCLPTTS